MHTKKRPTIGELLATGFARSEKEALRKAHANMMLGVADAQIANAQKNLEGNDKAKAVRRWSKVASAAISRIGKSEKQ